MKMEAFDKEELLLLIDQGFQPEYLCFWGHKKPLAGTMTKSCFSQWFESAFEVDDVSYPTAEHYMMAGKARLFDDEAIFQQILASAHPNEVKQLGRKVKNFDNALWEQHRFEIVVRGNVAKFGQNETLKAFLLATGNKVLVEASPVDSIWGIGLAQDHVDAHKPERWKGLNLLGFALMKVRDELLGK